MSSIYTGWKQPNWKIISKAANATVSKKPF